MTLWCTAPSELSLSRSEIVIWRAWLGGGPSLVRDLEGTLSRDEKSRASRFHSSHDRDRFIVARGILRELLGGYLNARPGELCFRYGSQGKPSLEVGNSYPPISFNISHTQDIAAYAFAFGQIGVDVERFRTDFDIVEIADRFFSATELKELSALPPDLKREAFFLCWTRKEAYIKARGEGLQIELGTFSVALTPGCPARFTSGVDPIWQIDSFLTVEQCPSAVVYQGPPCAIRYFTHRSLEEAARRDHVRLTNVSNPPESFDLLLPAAGRIHLFL